MVNCEPDLEGELSSARAGEAPSGYQAERHDWPGRVSG